MTNRFAHGVHLKRPCKVSTCRNLTARGTYGPNIAMSQVDLNLSACDSDSSIRQDQLFLLLACNRAVACHDSHPRHARIDSHHDKANDNTTMWSGWIKPSPLELSRSRDGRCA